MAKGGFARVRQVRFESDEDAAWFDRECERTGLKASPMLKAIVRDYLTQTSEERDRRLKG